MWDGAEGEIEPRKTRLRIEVPVITSVPWRLHREISPKRLASLTRSTKARPRVWHDGGTPTDPVAAFKCGGRGMLCRTNTMGWMSTAIASRSADRPAGLAVNLERTERNARVIGRKSVLAKMLYTVALYGRGHEKRHRLGCVNPRSRARAPRG